jgi:hypothetical protein
VTRQRHIFFSGCNEVKVFVGIIGLRVLVQTLDLRNTKQACEGLCGDIRCMCGCLQHCTMKAVKDGSSTHSVPRLDLCSGYSTFLGRPHLELHWLGGCVDPTFLVSCGDVRLESTWHVGH